VETWRWTSAGGSRRRCALLDDAARGLPEPEARGLRWRIHQNLGITHRERGALDESELWYRRAEEASSGLDDPSAVIEIRNGRGQLALARGAAREAELHFRKSLAALEGAAANEVRVAVRANLAESLLRQGRVLDAGEAAREAEAEGIRGGHFHRLPEVYRVLARVARARGVPEAFVFLDRALELVREQGLPRLQEARTLSEYADLREAEGEVEAARDARVRAQGIIADLSDSRAGDERRDDETFTNESMDPDGGES